MGNPSPNTSGLKPAKPGEVRNPKGINQYTYRRNFEATIDRLLAQEFNFQRQVVEDKEGEKVSCLICGLKNCDTYVGEQQYAHDACVQEVDGMTRGEVVAYVTVRKAMQGDEKMLPVVLERLWQKVTRHEVDLPGAESGALEAALNRFRPNGKDAVPLEPDSDGAV